jgi:hypothetical protein
MNTLEKLQSVLCDPEGVVCIAGSDGDRAVIKDALAELASIQSCEVVMRDAITKTLNENGHLADGENCTLIELKRALAQSPPQPLVDLCPRPLRGRPDGFTTQQCISAGECGCGASRPLRSEQTDKQKGVDKLSPPSDQTEGKPI